MTKKDKKRQKKTRDKKRQKKTKKDKKRQKKTKDHKKVGQKTENPEKIRENSDQIGQNYRRNLAVHQTVVLFINKAGASLNKYYSYTVCPANSCW